MQINSTILAALCATAGIVFGAQAQDAAPAPDASAEKAIIAKAMAGVAALDPLELRADEVLRVIEGTDSQEQNVQFHVAMSGQDKLLLEIIFDEFTTSIYVNGDKRNVYNSKGNVYIEAPAALSRQELFNAFIHPMAGMSLGWLAAFLHNDPALLEGASDFADLGLEKLTIEGEAEFEARHLSYSTEKYKIEVWLTPDKAPYLRKYTLDPAPLIAKSGQEGLSVLFQTIVKGGSPAEALPEAIFTFVPPEGAKLQSEEPEEEASGLSEGDAAPAISVALLDGGTLDLASFKEKNIVILDFWATWCGPCRMTLPQVDKVAAAYADKGVKVFAVNLREGAEQVKNFLTQQTLGLTAALDSEGKAANAFGVNGIPHLVIVDKKGIIRRVHVGASPTMEKELSEELDKLLGEGVSQ